MAKTKNDATVKAEVSRKRTSRTKKPLSKNKVEALPKRTRKPNQVYSDEHGSEEQLSPSLLGAAEKQPIGKKDSLELVLGQNSKDTRTKASVTKVKKSFPLEAAEGRDISKKRKKNKRVRYELDCSDVDIDILDFQMYLQLQVKVAGRKNNENLKVKVRGKIVTVQSAIYVTKDSVRFVIKKYLKRKKMRSVRVVAKSKNAYHLISR